MRARKKRGRRRGREGEREEGVAGCGKQGLGAVWLVTRAEREREREAGDGERSRVFLHGAVLRGFEEDLPLERSERPLFMMRDSSKPLA